MVSGFAAIMGPKAASRSFILAWCNATAASLGALHEQRAGGLDLVGTGNEGDVVLLAGGRQRKQARSGSAGVGSSSS